MNESEQDSEVTFGGVTMEQSEVIPEAGKKKKQVPIQSAKGTEDEEETEPILTGQMWADRAYHVLHGCLDSPDLDERPHQPSVADWCEQGFHSPDTLLNAIRILVRDGCIESFLCRGRGEAEIKLKL